MSELKPTQPDDDAAAKKPGGRTEVAGQYAMEFEPADTATDRAKPAGAAVEFRPAGADAETRSGRRTDLPGQNAMEFEPAEESRTAPAEEAQRRGGHGAGGGDDIAARADADVKPTEAVDGGAEPDVPDVEPPPWIRDAAGRLPGRPTDSSPTHGWAFDSAGNALSAAPWSSGIDVASTAGLRQLPDVPKGHFPYTFTDHVEGRVAEAMRRPGAPREVSVVLSNEPCSKYRYSCERILPHILPPDSRLRVFVKDSGAPDGVRWYRDYDGTGKGIA